MQSLLPNDTILRTYYHMFFSYHCYQTRPTRTYLITCALAILVIIPTNQDLSYHMCSSYPCYQTRPTRTYLITCAQATLVTIQAKDHTRPTRTYLSNVPSYFCRSQLIRIHTQSLLQTTCICYGFCKFCA